MAERKAPKKEAPKTPKKPTKKPSGKSKPKPKSKSVEVVGLPMSKSTLNGNSKYNHDNAEQAFKYCLLGADDKKLAMLFEVTESTLNLWKKKYPAFSESIKDGRYKADAEVSHSAYHIAKGYVDTKTKRVVDPTTGRIIEETVETFNVAPNPTANRMWLFNRQRQLWNTNGNSDIETQKLELAKQKQAFEEQMARERLELEKQKLELLKIRSAIGPEEETESDGFLEALNDSAQDAFEDFEDVE